MTMVPIHTSARDRVLRIRADERGMTFVFVGLSLMAFMAASMLAIDVGRIMTARTQAQRSADAGALAGATALVFNSFTDHTDKGPAVTSAVNMARANLVMGQPPSVTPADVTFPADPATGQSDLVEVKVYRSSVRANPVSNLIGPIFGVNSANISATARAMAAPAGAANCVLPFTIPDRWIENQTAPWTPDDTFDIYATKGKNQNSGAPLAKPDVYVPPGQPNATGYQAQRDKGLQLTLKADNQSKIAPSMYNPWDLPGSVGGSDYRKNIATCNSNLVKIGDSMAPENGNMAGPTKQGTDDLIAQDPKAYWDTSCNCVKGSAYATSPRVRIAPLYDPTEFAKGQHTGKSNPDLKVVNYLGFFVEGVTGGGDVTGRITPITARLAPGAPPPIGAFAQVIMLVK